MRVKLDLTNGDSYEELTDIIEIRMASSKMFFKCKDSDYDFCYDNRKIKLLECFDCKKLVAFSCQLWSDLTNDTDYIVYYGDLNLLSYHGENMGYYPCPTFLFKIN